MNNEQGIMNNEYRRCSMGNGFMVRIFLLIPFALSLLPFISTHAQETAGAVKILARPYQDSIQLRWAPTSYELWQAGMKNGYVIERYTILSNNELVKDSRSTRKIFDGIKPFSPAQWEPVADTNKYAGIAAAAIFGEKLTISTEKTTSMYDIVNLSTEQSNRYSFAMFAADMSPWAARAMGLLFTDKTAKKEESYLYKVSIQGYTAQKIDTGYILTGFRELRPLPKPLQFRTYKQGQTIMIAWDRLGSEDNYSAYMIDRALGNEGFKPLNKEPLINPIPNEEEQSPFFSYVDTLPSALIKVQYRVCGITPFGERGPWSDTSGVRGGPVLKEHPQIIQYESKDTKTVTIGWEFPKEDQAVEGFRIMRSHTDATGFKDISGLLPPKTRQYLDTVPLPTNYYKVFAIGKSGDITMSLAVLVQPVDSFPPAPPTRLMARVDSTGKVTLHWKANEEADIFGYRVYRANNMNEEFSQLTIAPVRDTVFYDKINIKTITRHIYYQLMAIDKRQNHSTFSAPLEVKRPDFIAPVRPVFKEIRSDERGVFLAWSSSTSDDVALQELWRYASDSTKKALVARFTDVNIESFIDSIACGDTVYHYTFSAIDEDGNRSVPAVIAGMSGRKPSSVITLHVKPYRNKRTIELTWNTPVAQGIIRYIIYRGADEEPLATYTSVDAPKTVFVEDRPVAGTKYTFSVRAQFTDGSLGAIARPVSVEY